MSATFTCPVCGGQGSSSRRKYIALSRYFEGLSIVRCSGCGLFQADPMPSLQALDEYYRVYWKDRGVDKGLLSLFTAQTQSRVRFLKPFLTGRASWRVLDIGAGYGPIAPALREALPGVQIIYDAVETDPAALDFLRGQAGARGIYAALSEVTGEYDLVVMTHVLEHMTDPRAFLREAARHTARGGLILAESPNLDFVYKAQNEPHVIFFSTETLQALARQEGLEVAACDTCGHAISTLVVRRAVNTFKRDIKAGIKSLLGKPAVKPAAAKAPAPAAGEISAGQTRDVSYVFETAPSGRAAVRIIARKAT